jgi:LysR family transcriptional regulator of gallate degradation
MAAVQYGNLLRAADESNISQSGLSRSIKSLETRLGVMLLVRKSKGVEPTIYGESVLRRAKIILNEVQRAVQEVKDLQAARIGELSVGITQNFAHYLVPEILAEIQASRPNIRISVVTGGFLELVEKVRSGAIEMAFGLLGAIEDDGVIKIEPLREHHSHVIARESHPIIKKKSVSARELAAERWVTLNSEGFQRNFAGFFQSRGLALPQQVLRTDSIDLIRKTMLSADILTILPDDIMREQIDAGSVRVVACEAPAELTHIGFVSRSDALCTPHMKLFIDGVRAAMRASPIGAA